MHYTYLTVPAGARIFDGTSLEKAYAGASERDAFALRISNVTGTAEAMDGMGVWHELNEYMVLEQGCPCEDQLVARS